MIFFSFFFFPFCASLRSPVLGVRYEILFSILIIIIIFNNFLKGVMESAWMLGGFCRLIADGVVRRSVVMWNSGVLLLPGLRANNTVWAILKDWSCYLISN